jgi:outer membrane lipoprotein-sorting protein
MRCIPGQGVLWETQIPVRRSSLITQQSITEIVGQQAVTTAVDSTGVSQTMLSLLSGHIGDIDDRFEISVSGDAREWTVQLTPKDSLVRQVINTISVGGTVRPQQLEVVHASGDRVVTTFSEPRLLTAAELEQTQEALKRAS